MNPSPWKKQGLDIRSLLFGKKAVVAKYIYLREGKFEVTIPIGKNRVKYGGRYRSKQEAIAARDKMLKDQHTTPDLTQGPVPVYAVSDETNASNFTIAVHSSSTRRGDFSYRRGVTGQSTLKIARANRRRVGVGDATTLVLMDVISPEDQNKYTRGVRVPGRTERVIDFRKKIAGGGLGGESTNRARS